MDLNSSVLNSLRVLVVDDEVDTLHLFERVLQLCGAEVAAVPSASAAMQQVRTWHPDVMLCDIMLEGEDGYSLMRKIRALGHDEGGDTPAAAVTVCLRSQDRRAALESGFQVHLSKPVEIDELVNTVAMLAGRSHRVH